MQNILLAFSAGLIAAFNPCGVVLLPSYITYLLAHKQQNASSQADLLMLGSKIGLLMTFGFIAVFFVTGSIISLLGTMIINYIPWLSVIVAVVFIFSGILLLLKPGIINGLHPVAGLGARMQQANPSNYFFYGVGYAFVSLGCTLPVFLMVVLTGFTTGEFLQGLFAFIAFALGMGMVVTLISVLSLFARNLVEKWIKRFIPYMKYIMAVFILSTGIYLLFYWLLGPGQLLKI